MTDTPYPIRIESDEAEELGISAGWYIFENGTIRGDSGARFPFSNEQEASYAISFADAQPKITESHT